ncbi:hypothetical protein MKW98_026182 [Papaver atlanticum]|uniref:F-box domain-containing protein n=1 Tax=Papaver atlanticum TaxID=357466 RepID=A0AAD4XZ95_9MAGN|nr:hypothetical protein MKW98_026182 [Papaver atlanticum]
MINKTWKRRIIVDYDNNPDHPASSLIVDDVVVYHILSRLSVKSLMRLKCVCKRWKLTIEQDPHSINLHLTHSETRPGLFVLLAKSAAGGASDYESYILAVLRITGRAANLHTISKTKLLFREILGPIAGLVCFVDNCAVRIYNVSTMESTPWIKSTVCMNMEKDNGIIEEPRCYFGFDPTTKKHKALFVWGRGKFQDSPVCEVLTVGDNTWRIIVEVLPYNIIGNITQYANGSIYWLIQMFFSGEDVEKYAKWIVAFDFGSEKFRVIPAPKFTVEYPDGKEHEFEFPIFSEVDGCLAVICQDRRLVKMCIFHDHNKENGTSSSSEKDWTQVTITLPSNKPEDWWFIRFHSIAGIGQIILETYTAPGQNGFHRNANLAKFYFYDRIQKAFRKFEVNGISCFSAYCRIECIATFVESLLPVQKKL